MDIIRYLRAHLTITSDRGAAIVEYVFLVALIALVCILAVGVIGAKTDANFSSMSALG